MMGFHHIYWEMGKGAPRYEPQELCIRACKWQDAGLQLSFLNVLSLTRFIVHRVIQQPNPQPTC